MKVVLVAIGVLLIRIDGIGRVRDDNDKQVTDNFIVSRRSIIEYRTALPRCWPFSALFVEKPTLLYLSRTKVPKILRKRWRLSV